MRALILKSGVGRRMGSLTKEQPKCMTPITGEETILSRQLKMLQQCGLKEIIMTTGLFDQGLKDYCLSLGLALRYHFVKNPLYEQTNYIYSIFLAKEYLDDDLILMHGDLVFEFEVLRELIGQTKSSMIVSSTLPLPAKDFKAQIKHGIIDKIGIEYFDEAMAAQPLYKLWQKDWRIWLDRISFFCLNGQVNCYAEKAFNEVSDQCRVYPLDIKDRFCAEIDTPEDLLLVSRKLKQNNLF